MRKSPFLVLLALVASCILAVGARAEDARVEVATIDGAPVYHWRPFRSLLADDVDRALVVRDFHRKGYELPVNVVDDAVKQQIADNFGGNADRFARHLRAEGATLADFRAYVSEEIIVNAMLYQDAKTPAERQRLRAQWLAGLRAGVVVKRLPGRDKASEG